MKPVTSGWVVGPVGVRARLAVDGPAGYSAEMNVWQYAQLMVRYENRLASAPWTITWHGPNASSQDQDTAGDYDHVVAELNRAGAQGWELVDVASLHAGDNRTVLTSGTNDWSITRYTFRRPYDAAAVTSTGPIPQQGRLQVQPSTPAEPAQPLRPATGSLGTGLGGRPQLHEVTPSDLVGSQGADLAGSAAGEPVTFVRLTAYWLADGEPVGSAIEGRGRDSAAGLVLIRREVARPRGPADIDVIESFRVEYQDPGVSKDRREQVAAAAADYGASWVEGQFGVAWWQASGSFPLSQAADLLDGSAEWLRGLVYRPLDDAASGAAGPVVDIGAGITANFVTAPLTRPLEGAACVCEIAGIVIGLATGALPLVLACAKRLAHHVIDQELSRGFEQVITSIGADRDRTAGRAPDAKIPAPEPPRPTGSAVPPVTLAPPPSPTWPPRPWAPRPPGPRAPGL